MSDENKTWATVLLNPIGQFLDSINAGVIGQTRFKLIPTAHLNRSTRAGVIDMTVRTVNGKPGAPIIRFDMPHKGTNFPHINIDPNGFPSRGNPHIQVPAGLIECASKIDKCLKVAGTALFIAAIVTDGCKILAAIYEDRSDKEHILPHKTIKTIAEIAGGWTLGLAGAKVGSLIGAKLGACMGGLFGGPVGALVGAPIGAVIGGMIGGFTGGLLGNHLGGKAGGGSAGLLEDYLAGNFTEIGSIKFEVEAWQNVFLPISYILGNPAIIASQIVSDIHSEDPKKVARGISGVTGGAVGATIGTTVLPGIGTVIGGVTGAAIGWASSWWR